MPLIVGVEAVPWWVSGVLGERSSGACGGMEVAAVPRVRSAARKLASPTVPCHTGSVRAL